MTLLMWRYGFGEFPLQAQKTKNKQQQKWSQKKLKIKHEEWRNKTKVYGSNRNQDFKQEWLKYFFG